MQISDGVTVFLLLIALAILLPFAIVPTAMDDPDELQDRDQDEGA